MDLIWPQDPPRTATHAIRVCVSALRSAFRDVPDVEIQLRGSGYALVTDPMNIDVHHFRSLTTSRFTPKAVTYADRVAARVILLDGVDLSGLMVRYNIGVQDHETYVIKRVDEDFFDEN